MTEDTRNPSPPEARRAAVAYRPPAITRLGSLGEMTQQKTVGAADGATFLGLDIGSI